ncbi:MAG: 3-dehydroquinate synthase [uncultured Thermomicrobiales bacterium]|uniref:Multifunctional fusion protein n=1 Tax=uncultured Thermomicrobiales bacterium TaxID=1645740 RepID=A0A6J4UIP7_9BACT|nr:MAG: 3-dehydroquinate synthase [uncultured Thermomicrobiales bacterium]
MERVERIVLIGFSGTGKSTVGRLLAEQLGWDLVDTDAEVEASLGMTIPEAFRRDGEGPFRVLERMILLSALDRGRVVVASGGGAAVSAEIWGEDGLERPGTLVVALDALPETTLTRLTAQRSVDGGTTERPLLAGRDPLVRIAELKSERQSAYDRAHVTLTVDRLSPKRVAEEIAALLPPSADRSTPELTLDAPSGRSDIVVRSGSLPRIGPLIRSRWPSARRAWLVSDENVAVFHQAPVVAGLTTAGFDVRRRVVAAGEGSKSLLEAGRLYDWLLSGGVERGDILLALGGGVVGDLGGFVAATVLRGIPLVQLPTSLLAMVDSSVGGKTGINHPAGKNLIGVFYQPPLVVIDPACLRTLPARELRSGWAEIVKHAVIQPSTPGGERSDLASFLTRNASRLRRLEEPVTSLLIRRNVALKAAVVETDEREANARALLNFGHTLGHAIEAAGYAYRHGEAIALGMRAAGQIGASVGSCGAAEVDRIDALLDLFALPRRAAVDSALVRSLLGSDKKRIGGRLRWVLPIAGGGVVVRDDVPAAAVDAALMAVSESVAAPVGA